MIKRITIILTLLLISLLLVAMPIFASTITGATYKGDVTITNAATLATNVSVPFDLSTASLITDKYIEADCLNTSMQINGADTAYMPGYDTDPWIVWTPSIAAGANQAAKLYTGGADMNGKIRWFPGNAGATWNDGVIPELGDDFEVEISGYITANATLFEKQSAFTISTDANDLTASILEPPTGFPTVVDTQSGQIEETTTHTLNGYASVAAGDLMLAFFVSDGNPTITFPAGWTELFNVNNGSDIRFGAWYKISAGGDGTGIQVTTSATESSRWGVVTIRDYYGVPVAATATGSSSSADPPNLSTGAAINRLWFAAMGRKGGSGSNSGPSGWDALIAPGTLSTTTMPQIRVTKDELNTASVDPGTMSLDASYAWVAATIYINAVPEITSVTAAGVVGEDHAFRASADGTNLKLYVNGVEKDSMALAGASVPDNANPIVFAASGSMPYVEYLKITVNGTLQQHIAWQYAATLTDQSGQDNHPTSVSLRTTSSDADVSASLTSFIPADLSKADITPGAVVDLIDLPDMPQVADYPQMYDEGHTEVMFFDDLLNPAINAVGIPQAFVWYPIAFATAIIAGFAAFAVTRQIIMQALISLVVMACFCGGGALGDGLLPWFTLIIFAVEAGMIFLIQEHQKI